jgi:hypothetical protein
LVLEIAAGRALGLTTQFNRDHTCPAIVQCLKIARWIDISGRDDRMSRESEYTSRDRIDMRGHVCTHGLPSIGTLPDCVRETGVKELKRVNADD